MEQAADTTEAAALDHLFSSSTENTLFQSAYGHLDGDAENARHEIAGDENAAPECKGGKCET